jgi:diguanylate cyclase (GGDEF)-like protein
MAHILIVDDRAINREFLVTLLGYDGHTFTEAVDGIEALDAVRARSPELIITDIAMPNMNGIEFIEQMQRDPVSARIPVIFYSATYRVPEARRMAAKCNAAAVIPKPSDPEVIIAAVRSALGEPPHTASAPPRAQLWNPSLLALMDFQCELAEERDANAVLELACRAAPTLIAAQCAVLGVESPETGKLARVLVRGLNPSATFAEGARVSGAFARRVAEPASRRLWDPEAKTESLGLPPAHPALRSLLVVPLQGARARYGWIYLANRGDGQAFSATDEELLGLLARQAAIAYENDLLADQAVHDGLTGLLNRREFDVALEREFQRALRQRSPLALAMADVDHFKQCNDRHGHAGGDAVLRALGAHLGHAVRGYDQVFRFGGEEFVILLPGATAADAVMRAEEIRKSFRALELRHDGSALGPVTLSFGVAAYPGNGSNGEALLQAADAALYEAKRNGRDRICVAALQARL